MNITFQVRKDAKANTWPQVVKIEVTTSWGDGDFKYANKMALEALDDAYRDAKTALSSYQEKEL